MHANASSCTVLVCRIVWVNDAISMCVVRDTVWVSSRSHGEDEMNGFMIKVLDIHKLETTPWVWAA